MLLTQNATNDWVKSWLFLPALYRKSVVCKKTMSETRTVLTSLCSMKRAHYSKRMLCKQDCVKFRGLIARQSFFEYNFADFSDVVRVKKIKISSSCWWRFQLATSPIGAPCQVKDGAGCGFPIYMWYNHTERDISWGAVTQKKEP